MEEDETGISVVCGRLVVPTEIDSPSMFHPTLICSSSSYFPPQILKPSSSSSSSSPVSALLHSNGAQVERETSMEEAMKSSLCKESSLQQQLLLHWNKAAVSEDSGGYPERWGLSGEGFSVDELLNLGDYVGSDKEAEPAEPFEADNMGRSDSESNSSLSSAASGLSLQPPAPPPPEPSPCDINLPAHDAAELEWVSFIIDDSHPAYTQSSGAGSFPRVPLPHSHEETTNLAAAAAQSGRPMETAAPAKAKRSKRLRSAVLSTAWFMSCSLLLAGSSSSTTTTTTSSTTSSYSSFDTSDACLIYDQPPTAAGDESFLLYDDTPRCPALAPAPKQAQVPPKKRGRKPKHPAAGAGERRCSHCGAQKTPQWRTGPLGAKTLCNACGVRFKSGRLLPEYRPACSPTFVSHVHSNSHRKVLEMRSKKEAEVALPAAVLPVGPGIG